MVLTAAGFWWEPPSSLTAFFGRAKLQNAFETALESIVQWRRAQPDDWPSEELLTGDFCHAQRGAFGFVAEIETRRLFLVPRGWGDQPEWALAESDLDRGRWRLLGHFEPLPSNWSLP